MAKGFINSRTACLPGWSWGPCDAVICCPPWNKIHRNGAQEPNPQKRKPSVFLGLLDGVGACSKGEVVSGRRAAMDEAIGHNGGNEGHSTQPHSRPLAPLPLPLPFSPPYPPTPPLPPCPDIFHARALLRLVSSPAVHARAVKHHHRAQLLHQPLPSQPPPSTCPLCCPSCRRCVAW